MKIRQILRVALLGLLIGFSGTACAADFKARITGVLFYEGGNLVYIYVEGGTKDRPSCAGSNGDYLSFSLTRPRAKEYLSGLMLAYAMKKPVTFRTQGACVDQSVSDTIVYFLVSDE